MKHPLPKLRHCVTAFFVLGIVCASLYSYTSTSSAPTGYTNAPNDANCTGCHGGSLITSGTIWGNISLSTNIPATGYIPDSTYNITLTHSQSGIVKFGFSATVLNSSNAKAGTLINTNSNTTLSTGSRDYIGHTSAGTSGSGSISWSFQWKAPTTAVGDITFYTITNATNNNNGTTGDQIYAKTFSFSQSTLLPTAVITPSATTICAGDTLYLQGSGANSPTIFTWTLAGGTPSNSALQNPKVVYNSAGTYTVRLVTRNSKGLSTASTVSITVDAKPSNTVIASGPLSFCNGDSVTLTSAPVGANITYSWSNSANTRSIVVKNTGNYQVTATNTSNGCSSTSSINAVTVRTLPIVSLSSSAVHNVICDGDSITLTATAGLKTYIFKNLSTVLQQGSSPVYKTNTLPFNSSIYVSATDSFNCTGLNSDTVYTNINTRLSAPPSSCGASGTDSVIFNWNTVNNATGYEISLDTGKTWNSPGSGNMGTLHVVRGLPFNHQVQLQVRAKTPAPCLFGLAATQTCSTKSCSGINYQLQSDTNICQGDTAEILISHISNRPYSIQFNGQTPVADSLFKVVPNVTESFTLLLRDSNAINCPPESISIQVHVESIPTASLSSNKINNAYCPGDSIQISAPNTFVNYIFIKNGTDTLYNGTQNNVISKPAQGDSIKVWVRNAAQCTGASAPIHIIKHLPPQVNMATPQYLSYRKYLFADSNVTAAKRWLWDFGDQSTKDTLASPTHTYAADGSYTVTLAISDSNGCVNYTQRLIQVAPFISARPALGNHAYWEIYPNPAASELFISNPGKVFSYISYSIYSFTGQLMQQQAAREDFNGWLDLSALPAGLYIIQLNDQVESGALKFQKR